MITRENYEEYFLSYVDDELTATVRAAVEKFVAENPDLRLELDALLQCRVTPQGEQDFPDKNILLHYEETLLSYIDGELEDSGRVALEEMLSRHPRAAVELRQLQMTVSQPDLSIVFPDKESLYRGQRRRAILLPWLSAGVAAAVLAAVALLFLFRQHPGETQHPNESITSVAKKIQPVVTSAPPSTLHPIKKNEQIAVVKEKKDRQVAVTKRVERAARVIEVVRANKKEEVAVADPQALVDKMPPVTAVAAVYIPKEQSSFATQALLQQEQEDSTDNSIADASATPAKNKLRGLFRKVGRAFGKTADRDGDGQRQVLIGAFQVALK